MESNEREKREREGVEMGKESKYERGVSGGGGGGRDGMGDGME